MGIMVQFASLDGVLQASYGVTAYGAAQNTVVPGDLAVPLPDNLSDHLSDDLGASLGIPGITAHRTVFADGPIDGKRVLVNGVLGTSAGLHVTDDVVHGRGRGRRVRHVVPPNLLRPLFDRLACGLCGGLVLEEGDAQPVAGGGIQEVIGALDAARRPAPSHDRRSASVPIQLLVRSSPPPVRSGVSRLPQAGP
ncbi:hypothetical protein [Streptomyces sp. NRRL B-24085]|uniref:hypothetical protein n=1 Tax=Streptomyces sp. NRRL B-24085 TaxID=1709476 RepID=UPI003B636FEB